MPPPSKSERLAEVFRRLDCGPAAATAEEALANLEKHLDAVEDEMTGIPKNPSRWRSDGRMYAPQPDNEMKASRKGARKFRTRGHYVWFGSNGAILVQDLEGKPLHRLRGVDGCGITGIKE